MRLRRFPSIFRPGGTGGDNPLCHQWTGSSKYRAAGGRYCPGGKGNYISLPIVQKVLNNGRFSPRPDIKPAPLPLIGVVNGLAVYGANIGTLIEVEASSMLVKPGRGHWTITGVVEEEQMGGADHRYTRKSMARGAVENVLTVLKSYCGLKISDHDIHINFPGGTPVDGPSAGICMATAVYRL